MAKLKELTIWLENKPGTLAVMAEALGKAKVNILALMTDEAEGQSRVRLVTDYPAKAGKTVTDLNLRFSEEEVVGAILAQQARNTGRSCREAWTCRHQHQPRVHRVRRRLEETAGRLCRERSKAGRKDFEMNVEQFCMDCWEARAEK